MSSVIGSFWQPFLAVYYILAKSDANGRQRQRAWTVDKCALQLHRAIPNQGQLPQDPRRGPWQF